jgi:hypothetical protein
MEHAVHSRQLWDVPPAAFLASFPEGRIETMCRGMKWCGHLDERLILPLPILSAGQTAKHVACQGKTIALLDFIGTERVIANLHVESPIGRRIRSQEEPRAGFESRS